MTSSRRLAVAIGAAVAITTAVSGCHSGSVLSGRAVTAQIPQATPCQLLNQKDGIELAGTSQSKTVAASSNSGQFTCEYSNGQNGRLSLSMAPAVHAITGTQWNDTFNRVKATFGGAQSADHYIRNLPGLGYNALTLYQVSHVGGSKVESAGVVWFQGRVMFTLRTSSTVSTIEGEPPNGAQIVSVAQSISSACHITACSAPPAQ